MTTLTIAGGVYHERCIWPEWDQIYGSAGRAAAAVTEHVNTVRLVSCIRPDTRDLFLPYASAYGIELNSTPSTQTVSFEYFHSLSTPVIRPAPALIVRQPELIVEDKAVLRFGMMETTVRVKAERCVYDPQSVLAPQQFHRNGSTSQQLALVGNTAEICALATNTIPIDAAKQLISDGYAHLVVIKSGPEGAVVIQKNRQDLIPAFQSEFVWTIGTGDVFAGMFAARWGVHEDDPRDAAYLASKAVATYVNTMSLPIPSFDVLRETNLREVNLQKGRVYLAAPFFCIGQRWIVDEARRCLADFGMEVFSPIHDVGSGPPEVIAPADLEALKGADVVFALLDGLDPGTLFEVGYARARNIPVYALAQAVSANDLKMFSGSGCNLFSDLVTALHHLAWRA